MPFQKKPRHLPAENACTTVIAPANRKIDPSELAAMVERKGKAGFSTRSNAPRSGLDLGFGVPQPLPGIGDARVDCLFRHAFGHGLTPIGFARGLGYGRPAQGSYRE